MDIYIEERFYLGWGMAFGLVITGDRFPVYVGCSFKVEGEIIDEPARWLRSPGKALWEPTGDWSHIFRTRRGEVIFALYSDDTFEERLTDTGWVSWWAMGSDVISSAKTSSRMKSTYKDRNSEWF